MKKKLDSKYMAYAFVALLGHLVLPAGLRWMSIKAFGQVGKNPQSVFPWEFVSDVLNFDAIIASIVLLVLTILFVLISCIPQEDK